VKVLEAYFIVGITVLGYQVTNKLMDICHNSTVSVAQDFPVEQQLAVGHQ